MSNKTVKKQLNETESAPNSPVRDTKKLIFGVLILFVGLWVLYSGVSSLFDNTRRLLVPNGFITVEVADTPELRQLGLSGRTELSDKNGMLFVFDSVSTNNCLVMRDMLIPIDMVWMNEEREVINVKTNATPESYPEEVFCPTEPAKYALEITANNAESLGITKGETLRW